MANRRHYQLAVLVAALGYFVDIYDLLLFSIVRVSSLKSLGVPDEQILEKGVLLINTQMAGLLVGGIFWGILGDKRGRLSVLFGSIILYSLANLANAFVHSVEMYAALRFIAGLGLAGELGAGITLVTELMPKEKRGWGTAIVSSVGIAGAVFAASIADIFDWRTCYIIGGVMGLCLLGLRVGVVESHMFKSIREHASTKKNSFIAIFKNRTVLKRYLSIIMVGMPLWYTVGVLVTFAPEIGKALGLTDLPTAGRAVMMNYGGLVFGDLLAGALSQYLQSRKKALFICLATLSLTIVGYFVFGGMSRDAFYIACFVMGIPGGYWCMFVTVAAEQFGTNIRATTTTTVPNFVRGMVIPLTAIFQCLKPFTGISMSAALTGGIVMTISFIGLMGLQETFGKDLNYIEEV